MLEISTEKTSAPKTKPDQNNLVFGKNFTDHMFIMDYTEGRGWHDPRIIPYQPLVMEPSSMSLVKAKLMENSFAFPAVSRVELKSATSV